MGAFKKIEWELGDYILNGLSCSLCLKKFTEQDKEVENWEIHWDTPGFFKLVPVTNDVFWSYKLETGIRSIEHESCPN